MKLSAEEAGQRIRAKLAWLPNDERRYWEQVLARSGSVRDSVFFLALALDEEGNRFRFPVPIAPPACSWKTLPRRAGGLTGKPRVEVAPFADPFPLGLYVEGLGPLVANDAYASRDIWERFKKDPYHGPRVVWGREVNLLLLGLAKQIGGFDRNRCPRSPWVSSSHPGRGPRVGAGAQRAVELSDRERTPEPTRYGTSSDIQLWNGTNLAVQYVLSTARVPYRLNPNALLPPRGTFPPLPTSLRSSNRSMRVLVGPSRTSASNGWTDVAK